MVGSFVRFLFTRCEESQTHSFAALTCSFALRTSPRTIEQYVSKVLNFGDVKINTKTMEFFIIEAVLKHPKKTLSEIAHDVYTETGSDFALARIFYFLKRNRLSLKKICLNFSALESIFQ